MLHHRVSATLLAVVGVIGVATLSGFAEEKSSKDDIAEANARQRELIESALLRAAEKMKVSIDKKSIVHASTGDALVVNSAIQGLQEIGADQLKEGANLLFIYISPPKDTVERTTKKRVPAGFYIVKGYIDEKSLSGRAELLDATGSCVMELPMTITSHEPKGDAAARALGVSGHIDVCSAGVDAVIRGVRIDVTVSWC
jgi:hypothetical protein